MDKGLWKWISSSAIVASMCCLPSVVMVMFGLASVSTADCTPDSERHTEMYLCNSAGASDSSLAGAIAATAASGFVAILALDSPALAAL